MALLGLLAVAVMVFAYVLTSRLNAASQFVGVDREHNAKVLAQAKQALIGWMAINAATDNNPGRLPCPEAVNAIGTNSEGVSAPLVSPSTPNCATVGRLPWRTLGLGKLVDAASEPLWYAVSPGWALQNSSTLLSINSDSRGAMVVDGQVAPNEVVALIIAPGPAMNVQAASGCTAQAQARALPAPAMDPLNYIECFNAATPAFSTTGPATSFNDQVVRVTAADLMPALEAAIAERMQREIAPALRGVYTSSIYAGIPASTPLYPYAAPWANPGPGSGTSDYRGVASTYKGLLPFNQTQGCNPATDPRCTTTLVAWASGTPPTAPKVGGYGFIMNQACSWQSGGTIAVCEGEYEEDNGNPSGAGILMEMTTTINNVAMGLRKLDWTRAKLLARNSSSDPWLQMALEPAPDTLATMNADGSVTIKFRARLPNVDAMSWGHKALYQMSLERAVIGDHALLDPNDATLGWFVRNEWYRTTYYATVRRNTAVALSTLGCIDSSDTNVGCVRFNDSSTRNIRALLVLAGRSLGNPAGRPNAVLADYVEYQNCDWTGSVCDPQTLYEQRPMRSTKVSISALNAPFNDRVVLVDWSGSLLVPAQAVTTSPLRLATRP
ncbi:MAG TPA: hypothetical protein VGA44_10385 [Steroidobacteraceae bacterium]